MSNNIDNIAKRGTEYVADSRGIGNGLDTVKNIDFSKYNVAFLCYGVNDYIQAAEVGDINIEAEGTIIENASLTFKKNIF